MYYKNSKWLYKSIAEYLVKDEPCMVAWKSGNGEQFNILFSCCHHTIGEPNFVLRGGDFIILVISHGAFGFSTNWEYIDFDHVCANIDLRGYSLQDFVSLVRGVHKSLRKTYLDRYKRYKSMSAGKYES